MIKLSLKYFDFEECKVCKRYDKWIPYCNHCDPKEDSSHNHFKPIKSDEKGYNLCWFCSKSIKNQIPNIDKCYEESLSIVKGEYIKICGMFKASEIL